MIRYREALRCRDELYHSELQAEFDLLAAEILAQLEAEDTTETVASTVISVDSSSETTTERARKQQGKLWRDVVAEQLFEDESKGLMPFPKSAARTDRSGKRGPRQNVRRSDGTDTAEQHAVV